MADSEKEIKKPEENFKDFDDEQESNQLPELEQDLIEEDEEGSKDIEHDFSHKFDDEHQLDEIHEKLINENEEQGNDEAKHEELSSWEEYDEENSVVKKYIFHISKDFVPYLDNLSTDKRSAYINDTIQIKMDLESENKQKEKKQKVIIHFILMILTICLSTPIALLIAHKAIMATFENYRYSQENFEKLYKQRLLKDKAYLRSIQYNKEIKLKNTDINKK